MRYKIILTAIVVIFVANFSQSIAQSTTCPALVTNNYTVTCATPCINIGVAATLNLNSTTSYSVSSIPYAPYSLTAGTNATYTGTSLLYGNDDYYGDAVPFFNFCFFGNTYNQIVLGSNDNATFDVTQANSYDPWEITGPLPGAATGTSNTAVDDAIMFPWNDIYSDIGGGNFTWNIYGTAPCRQFVYSCNDVPLFDGSAYCAGIITTTQMVLYESSNIIDVYIATRTSCPAWNTGWALNGICNATGSAWAAAPGENATTFGATNEGWRYSPNGATAGWTFTWYDSTRTTVLGSGDSINVCPTLLGVNKYYVQAVSLACSGVTLWDSVTVTNLSNGTSGSGGATIYSVTVTNPTVCGDNDGTISLTGGITPFVPDTVNYSFNGVPQPPIYTTAGADSVIVLTGLIAGNYTNITIANGSPCPSIVNATLVNPPMSANFTLVQHQGCTGDTVLLSNASNPLGYSSHWTFGDGTFDTIDANPTHAYIIPGTYTITLVYSTYNTCFDTVSQSISFSHVLNAGFSAVPDSVCLGTPITFNNSTVSSSGATYLWNFNDGGQDTLTSPVHIFTVGGIYDVSLTAKDGFGCTQTVNEKVDVVSISIRPAENNIINCNNTDSLNLSVIPTTTGGFSNIVYNWVPTTGLGDPYNYNTKFFDTSAPHVFTYFINASIPLPSGGCPPASTTINIVSYNLIASYFTNFDTVCLGSAISFTNMTEFFASPTYNWNFRDGSTDGSISPVHTFNAPGIYSVVLTATDTNNCKSDTTETEYVISVQARTMTHDTSVCLYTPMFLDATVQVQPNIFAGATKYTWLLTNGSGSYLGSPTDTVTSFFAPAASPYTEYTYLFNAVYYIDYPNNPCFHTDTEDIYVYPPDTLYNVTQNTTVQYGASVQLNADGAYYFWWTPENGTISNPNINNPIVTPTDSITVYTVYGMTKYGCRDSASVTITVIPDNPPFIPNAFTPGVNPPDNTFGVRNLINCKLVEMRIFNRWGNQVFYTVNPELGWDGTYNGTPQDMDTYFYSIILAYPDGVQKTYTGDVTLIR